MSSLLLMSEFFIFSGFLNWFKIRNVMVFNNAHTLGLNQLEYLLSLSMMDNVFVTSFNLKEERCFFQLKDTIKIIEKS